MERRKDNLLEFFKKLKKFTKEKISQKILDQDLNFLLSPEQFVKMRKILKNEVLIFLEDEIKKIKNY